MFDAHGHLLSPAAGTGLHEAAATATGSWPAGLLSRSGIVRWSALAAAAWLQDFNGAWQERDWERLARRLAVDAEYAAHGMGRRISGRSAIVALYRRRYARVTVGEYAATDLRTRAFGGVGIVQFRWDLELTDAGGRGRQAGQTEVGLRLCEAPWKALWISELRR